MLGPFRIRNLGRATTTPNRASYASPARRGSSEAVVSITGTEYDYNVLMHPETKLKYLDEDDGEVITAGTSLELAQRLEDPVPTFAKSRQKSERPVTRYDSIAPMRTASPDMHIFEIDRRGDSVRIWEEIEQRTMQLQLSQVPMQPEANPSLAYPFDTSDNIITPPNPISQKPVPNLRWPLVHRDRTHRQRPGREDDMSVQVDESDDIYRLQELREAHDSSYEGQLVTNTQQSASEHARLQVFLASNPPKLFATSSEESTHNTRHTSMKLSDVLNDDAGPRNGPGDTAPLLASFCEGSLTAEGRRQAMEAGNKLRARTNPVYHFNIHQHRISHIEDANRWASYGNVKPTGGDVQQSTTTTKLTSPLLAAPTEEALSAKGSEGSLLQAFRAELEKMSGPVAVESQTANDPAVEARPNVDNEDIMNKTLPSLPAPNLEAIVSKLMLQAISSIGSTVETLQSQLRHHVLDALPSAPTEEEVTKDSPKCFVEAELRHACDEFENSTELSLVSLKPEFSTSGTQEDLTQVPESSAMVAGVECLQSLTCAFQELSRRLRTIEDIKNGTYVEKSLTPQVTLVIDPVPRWAQHQDVTGIIRQLARHDANIMEHIQGVTVIQPSNSKLPVAICRIDGYKAATMLCTILNGQLWENSRLNVESTLSSPLYPDIKGRLLVGLHKAPLPHHIRGSFGQDGHWNSARVPGFSLSINNRASMDIYSTYPTVQSNIIAPLPETKAVNITKQESDIQPTKVQCVRFEDHPVTPKTTRSDGPRISNATGRTESINYRHVLSDMRRETANPSRSRTSLKHSASFSSGPPYKYVDAPTEREPRFKRRSMPLQEVRHESRSRSRSPVPSVAFGELDVKGNSLSRSYQWPQSFHQSNLPVRQHREQPESNLPTEAIRPFGSTSAPNSDHKISGYKALDQQSLAYSSNPVRPGRPTDKASASYVSTLRHFGHIYDRSRASMGAQVPMRHSKSLNAIRGPPQIKQPSLRNNKHVEWSAGTSITPKEPFDDCINENAELFADFDLAMNPNISNAAPPNSPLVITRFPTLEEFESGSRTNTPQFPPLPSMEPLVPLRPNAPRADDSDQNTAQPTTVFAKANDPTSNKIYESGWPPRTGRPEDSESSGNFFCRMTGLNDSPKISVSPASPVRLGPAAPGARLIKPFDPLAETATIHRHQLIDGIRRSATMGSLHDRYATNRRPYSAYFDGNGRVEWDAFIEGNRMANSTVVDPADATHSHPVHRRQSEEPHSTQDFDATIAPIHQDPTTVRSVQECVDQLIDLGFGEEVNGGKRRLVVYAQAAEGKLEEAIDMIDDERRAYEEREPVEG